MKCPKCNEEVKEEVKEEDKFCDNCGHELYVSEDKLKLKNIILAIVLIINTIFLIYFFITRNTFHMIIVLMIYILAFIITLSESKLVKIIGVIICALIIGFFAYVYYTLANCDFFDLIKGCE